MIVSFDIKVVLYVLGLAGVAVVSDRLSRFRRVAAPFLGATTLIVGLILLKQSWFQGMLE